MNFYKIPNNRTKAVFISIPLILVLVFFNFSFFSHKKEPMKLKIAGLAVSDVGVGEQWYLEKIKASDAWFKTQGSKDVVVAVIDTGIDLDHPDLKNNIWKNENEIIGNNFDDDNNGYTDDVYGWDFVDGDGIPEPNLNGEEYDILAVNHGTIVSGIIAAEGNNAFAGAGVSWHAKIMPLRVFNNHGESDTYLVEQAIQYAIDNGADIINMSFVGLGYSESLNLKIKSAYDAGILLVAAAGNDDGSVNGNNLDVQKSYPVCNDGASGENWVLGVAAVDEQDVKTEFSHFGKSCIDIAAPGKDINSSLFYKAGNADFNKYFGGGLKGTSVSVPQVVGAAVLLKALYPHYTNKELMQILMESADEIDSLNLNFAGRLGKGRLNVLNAINAKAISGESEEELRVKYVLAAGVGEEPKVWLLDSKGEILKEFYVFAPGFRGGVNVALGDIDNDGAQEIVAGAGLGGGPHIRIFNLKGELEGQFFAFDRNRRNGVLPAIGDIDGDNKKEITAIEAGHSKVLARVFNKDGKILKDGLDIFGYMTNTASLALSDVNRDGKDEIIAGAAQGTQGKIKVLSSSGDILGEFFPFEKYFYGGINVSAGDLNNDGWSEIITARKVGNSQIKTFTYNGRLLSPGFLAYDVYSGAHISSGDRDGDREFEIIATQYKKSAPKIKVWDKKLDLQIEFYPFGNNIHKNVSAFIITR